MILPEGIMPRDQTETFLLRDSGLKISIFTRTLLAHYNILFLCHPIPVFVSHHVCLHIARAVKNDVCRAHSRTDIIISYLRETYNWKNDV